MACPIPKEKLERARLDELQSVCSDLGISQQPLCDERAVVRCLPHLWSSGAVKAGVPGRQNPGFGLVVSFMGVSWLFHGVFHGTPPISWAGVRNCIAPCGDKRWIFQKFGGECGCLFLGVRCRAQFHGPVSWPVSWPVSCPQFHG